MSAPPDPHHRAESQYCRCETCLVNEVVLRYIFTEMEPTDRALRPAPPR